MKKILVAVLILAFALAGCNKEEPKTEEQPSVIQTFSGEMTDAMGNEIIVKNSDTVHEFETNDSTIYNLGKAKELTVGDMVDVEYVEKDSGRIAKTVKVTKERVVELFFNGTINDVNGDDITVTGSGLTVHFLRDGKTKIKGKLANGNQVKVTYTGDISEYPYATKIKVTKEKPKVKSHKVKGDISELMENSMLLRIDSARSYWFRITDKTKIKGDLQEGYSVTVKYKGDIDEEPKADRITVTKIPVYEVYTIEGTVKQIQGDSFIIDTGKKLYTFTTKGNTKYSGKKMKKGYIATVTYIGELNDSPTAVGVYCVKPKKKTKEKKVADPKPVKKKTEKKKKQTEKEDILITVYGEITEVNNAKLVLIDEHDDELKLNISDDSTISSGYMPEAGDHVEVTYFKDRKTLDDIQLLYRPEDEEEEDEDL